MPVFKTGAINRSATSPVASVYRTSTTVLPLLRGRHPRKPEGATPRRPVVRCADMSSAPGLGSEAARVIADFCAEQFEPCRAGRYGFDLDGLVSIVSAVVERWNANVGGAEVRQFLSALHLEELVLTRACAAGSDAAWDEFLSRYRSPLYGAAYKIAPEEATARELADSLYAELYGISDSGTVRASKLLYYSGRGSLEGWLRTVLAQEFVNRHRKTRRETSLDQEVEQGKQFSAPPQTPDPPADVRIDQATAAEIATLDAEERFILASYFLDGRKLAEIGRLLGVHESTISRKLERSTAALRKRIRKRLIDGGMSAREADEAIQDVDVRDLQVPLEKSLRQESNGTTFYKGSDS